MTAMYGGIGQGLVSLLAMALPMLGNGNFRAAFRVLPRVAADVASALPRLPVWPGSMRRIIPTQRLSTVLRRPGVLRRRTPPDDSIDSPTIDSDSPTIAASTEVGEGPPTDPRGADREPA
jgi:hypothetical protein